MTKNDVKLVKMTSNLKHKKYDKKYTIKFTFL
jgi:hypothetical protein